MTNEQKFKMPEERIAAFNAVCDREDGNCINCPIGFRTHKETIECFAHWLALEAEEEKPMPCPFCGKECEVAHPYCGSDDEEAVAAFVRCTDEDECSYNSAYAENESAAIAAHNRVARAVRAEREGEVK